MAKLNLKATGRGESVYSAFTKNYRQSPDIEDRRGNQFRPSSTNPRGGYYGGTGASGGGSGRVQSSGEDLTGNPDSSFVGAADGDWMDRYRTQDTETPSSTRKVSAEEAIQKTFRERK